MLLTASTEDTATAYDDGEIGESYLGIIYNISSSKLPARVIIPDTWQALSTLNKALAQQKIESVCALPSNTEQLTLILVADDDKGGTRLFELKLGL